MAHASAVEARLPSPHALRALLAAAICTCVLALLCAAALVNEAPAPWDSTGPAQTTLSAPAPAAAVDSGNQIDNDVAMRPKVDGIGVRHALRKPRRSNRRLRVPGRDRAHSGITRAGTAGIGTTQLQLKRKRTSKRALMQRLMTVRGGLQA
jgi:hypothetical protein